MPSLARFLHAYLRPAGVRVRAVEARYTRADEALDATLYTPDGRARGLPGWVMLHGLAHTGRAHPSLVRFARAVAASGTAVLVPDIPEWRALEVVPAATLPTIRAAVLALDARPEVRPGDVGLFGFSFGATQALVAAADPALRGHLSGVAAWGGYRDLERLFDFGLTGRHELDGVEHHIEPDPYGRWIMGGNYLTAVPGYEGEGAVAGALHQLARAAGAVGVFAGDAAHDPLKRELRSTLPPASRALFDLFAPPAGVAPADMDQAHALAGALARAAVRVEPLLDPGPHLAGVPVPVVLAHGRDDRLIPFTETLRLARDLPASRVAACRITALFAHSGGTDRSLGPAGLVTEGLRFAAALRRTLSLV